MHALTPHRCRITRSFALLLAVALLSMSCAQSIVAIRPPYTGKLRVGDGVKVTDTSGVIHTGRVVFLDRSVIVVRTPKQVITEKPVVEARFATTIRWDDVRKITVAGVLDSEGQLISNEEIRVNLRTNDRRNYAVNIGMLGSAVSFLGAAAIQGAISPADTDLSSDSHGAGRVGFWSAWAAGTALSGYLGWRLGDRQDRRRSIARIERDRQQQLAASRLDSLQTEAQRRSGRPAGQAQR